MKTIDDIPLYREEEVLHEFNNNYNERMYKKIIVLSDYHHGTITYWVHAHIPSHGSRVIRLSYTSVEEAIAFYNTLTL